MANSSAQKDASDDGGKGCFKKGCCCFRTLRSASIAAGMFTLMTSLMQWLVILAVFVGLAEPFIKDNKNILYKPVTGVTSHFVDDQPTVGALYIALACADFIIICVSFILLYGIEARKFRRAFFYPWIVVFPFYIAYESAINIYYFYLSFDARHNGPAYGQILFTSLSTLYGFLVVPLIYWAVKEIIILAFWFAVIFYVKSLTNKDPVLPSQESAQPDGSTQFFEYPPRVAPGQGFDVPAGYRPALGGAGDPVGYRMTPSYRPGGLVGQPTYGVNRAPIVYSAPPRFNTAGPYGRAAGYAPAVYTRPGEGPYVVQ